MPTIAPGSIALEFGFSRSARYADAVKLASKLPGYTCTGEGKTQRHHIPVALPASAEVMRLFKVVYAWTSTRLVVDGEAGKLEPNGAYSVIDCYRRRTRARSKPLFCFGRSGETHNDTEENNKFGCCHFAELYHWKRICGEISSDDPAAGEQLLQAYEARAGLWLCPAYDPERTRAGLVKPDRVPRRPEIEPQTLGELTRFSPQEIGLLRAALGAGQAGADRRVLAAVIADAGVDVEMVEPDLAGFAAYVIEHDGYLPDWVL